MAEGVHISSLQKTDSFCRLMPFLKVVILLLLERKGNTVWFKCLCVKLGLKY